MAETALSILAVIAGTALGLLAILGLALGVAAYLYIRSWAK